MDVIRRRNQHTHNEENISTKSTKQASIRPAGTRTALSNISNIQKPVNTNASKKKDATQTSKPAAHKVLGRVKSQSNLMNEKKKYVKEPVSIIEVLEDGEIDALISEEEDDDIMTLENFANLSVDDIDLDDLGNPTLCAEYVKDIYKYMRKLEKHLKPNDYMLRQSEINRKMRSILIDWLIQVQCRFNLLQETLYLTVYIIDRFLNNVVVTRTELQLVGVTAMLLASKYEEMYAPEIGDFVYITDNAYSKIKIRSMEQKMLKALDYDFTNPLCIHFLRRISKAGSVDSRKHTLAKYLMELTLIDYNFTQQLPSKIAAAALYISIKVLDNSEWSTTLHFYSEYSEKEILPLVGEMAALVLSLDSSKYQAVYTKYSSNKFLKISRLAEIKGETMKQLSTYCTK